MKFIRSNIEQNEIIMYYQNDEGKIKKKKYPYNRLIPLTHKRKHKKYPANSVSTSDIYNKMYNCDFKYEVHFNDLDF
tara:strand:- start:483 stop:713 length:231 start_codon:yes stop_codon:yes gene_type:complete